MSRRRKGRPVHGWLVLDKDTGLSSNGALGQVKRLLKPAKVGHAGTLDPLASGILPLAFGEATKTVSYAMDGRKTYSFTVRWGAETTTDDEEGDITERSRLRPSPADIDAILPSFLGQIQQVPPVYAAIKIDGERAYARARRGEDVTMIERQITIENLVCVSPDDADHARFEVTCGKGTYVRAIARDMGRKLGCLGHICALRRLAVGPFLERDAISLATLEKLVEDDAWQTHILPTAIALADIPAIAVTASQAKKLTVGQSILAMPQMELDQTDGETLCAMHGDTLVALLGRDGSSLRPVRVFNPTAHTVTS